MTHLRVVCLSGALDHVEGDAPFDSADLTERDLASALERVAAVREFAREDLRGVRAARYSLSAPPLVAREWR